jgi:ketosteroid isomerase-like protein
MTQTQIRNLDREGEVRPFQAHGQAVLASAGGVSLLKGTFEPGWRYSVDVAPLSGTKTCQTRHLGYVISGTMHVTLDSGEEYDIGPGDLFDLPPGHDAAVVGKERCVMIDVSPEATRYATGGAASAASEDRYLALVRKGFAAFNAGDIETLVSLMAKDIVHHVPGSGPLAGEHKGIESVLAMYGQLNDLTGGNFRADLIDVHGDGQGHVAALNQSTATRNGVTRVSRGTLLFTFVGNKITDILELHADLAGDDAFMAT